MTELTNNYKDGVDCITIPEYSIEELKSIRKHKKYVRQKRHEKLVAAVLFILLISVAASVTAYAATLIRNIQFTSYGLKIDFSAPEGQAAPDSVVSFEDAYGTVGVSREDFIDKTNVNTFDNWEDALKVIEFPITYPQNIQCSNMDISIYHMGVCDLVKAAYVATGKVVEIDYTCYLDERWGVAIDYNAQIIDNEVYTNNYKYDFWITECQYGDSTAIVKAVAYRNNYVIQMSFYGFADNEIYAVLDELDLSVYE